MQEELPSSPSPPGSSVDMLAAGAAGALSLPCWWWFRSQTSWNSFAIICIVQMACTSAVVLALRERASRPSSTGTKLFGALLIGLPWLTFVDSVRFSQLVKFFLGLSAITGAATLAIWRGHVTMVIVTGGVLLATGVAAPFLFMALLKAIGAAIGGGAWGRPLRIRGRQLHPNLRSGADWTAGDRPDPRELDQATRAALEALWLHDAQKEHASVPAFSRLSWLLAAVGAPAELLAGCHRAAMEEIDHTQRCFALAAGYAGRSFTVEAMPELLLGGLDLKADPLVTIAVESLADGCQLEDFNADVAALCAAACQEPVTRDVLERIAREERAHAELSWSILVWTLSRDRTRVEPALVRALARLDAYPRPTAVSNDKAALVARADEAALRRHGRLRDDAWADAWSERLVATRARVAMLLRAPAAYSPREGGRSSAPLPQA